MVKVGITGGIGCGKSTVAKAFEIAHGVPVYLMDNRIRYLINTNKSLQHDLKVLIGAEAFLPDGSYNSKMVAEIAFNDNALLHLLNKCVEPYLIKDLNDFYQAMELGHAKYVLVEAAYFFEYHMQHLVDFMIGVDATFPVRLSRAQKRDNATTEQIMARIKNQIDQDEKMKRCDFVVDNNEGFDPNELKHLDDVLNKIYKYGINIVCRTMDHGVRR